MGKRKTRVDRVLICKNRANDPSVLVKIFCLSWLTDRKWNTVYYVFRCIYRMSKTISSDIYCMSKTISSDIKYDGILTGSEILLMCWIILYPRLNTMPKHLVISILKKSPVQFPKPAKQLLWNWTFSWRKALFGLTSGVLYENLNNPIEPNKRLGTWNIAFKFLSQSDCSNKSEWHSWTSLIKR